MEKIRVELVIEKGNEGLWGRVTYNNNLIAEHGSDLPDLSDRMKKLLLEFEGVDPAIVEFSNVYDVYALFQEFDFLNVNKVAEHAGIDPELLQQYSRQDAYPSAEQAKIIENTLHRLADELSKVSICAA